MHLPKFAYLRPSSIQEAASLLETHGSRACLAAGGTELFPRMKYGLNSPEVLISLKGLRPASPTFAEDGTLVIDALMTLAAVNQSESIRKKALLLTEAAGQAASSEIRNMGTLGGNICQQVRCLFYNQKHDFQFVDPCFKRGGEICYFIPQGKKCLAVFMADTVPALVCLDAEIKVIGPNGARQIPVEKFYSGNALQPFSINPNEVVAEIRIPKPAPHCGSSFVKFSLRGGVEFAALQVAVVLNVEADGVTCVTARITVGSVFASPLRALKTESSLAGKALTEQSISEAAQSVIEEIHPIPHHGFSKAYLKECLRVQSRKALRSAAGRVDGKVKGT